MEKHLLKQTSDFTVNYVEALGACPELIRELSITEYVNGDCDIRSVITTGR